MKLILFPLYYFKLLVSVMLGIHQPSHPLNLKWRWKNWNFRNPKNSRERS